MPVPNSKISCCCFGIIWAITDYWLQIWDDIRSTEAKGQGGCENMCPGYSNTPGSHILLLSCDCNIEEKRSRFAGMWCEFTAPPGCSEMQIGKACDLSWEQLQTRWLTFLSDPVHLRWERFGNHGEIHTRASLARKASQSSSAEHLQIISIYCWLGGS